MSKLSYVVRAEKRVHRAKRRTMRYAKLRKAVKRINIVLAEILGTLVLIFIGVALAIVINSL